MIEENDKASRSVTHFVSCHDRQITVSGIGDLVLLPNNFSLNICILSKKDSSQDAKNSVSRRYDYVKQVLGIHNVQAADQRHMKHLHRVASMFHMVVKIHVQFSNLSVCQSVSNLLTEKMDTSVHVSLPKYSHTNECLDVGRRKCGLLAIQCAKVKANELARVVHRDVGKVLSVNETQTESCINEKTEEMNGSNSFMPYDCYNDSGAIDIRSKVIMTVELKSKR